MQISESELQETLEYFSGFFNLKSYFPIDSRNQDYRPYFKSEALLSNCVNFSESLESVLMNKIFLELLLDKLEGQGRIEFFEREDAKYKIRSPRYDIYLRLLHFGDIAQYTVHRKTNFKSNFSRSMKVDTIQKNIEEYL